MINSKIILSLCFILVLMSSSCFSLYYLYTDNPNSYDLIDFQVKVNISNITYYNFKIVDQNGNEIPYCFEQPNGECTTSKTNTIWIKANLTPGKNTFYVIPSTTNHAVNGDQVFDFYDDFTKDLSKWNLFGYPSPRIKDGTYLDTNGDSWYNSGIYSKKTFNYLKNYTLEGRIKETTGYIWDDISGFGFAKTNEITQYSCGDGGTCLFAGFSIWGEDGYLCKPETCNVIYACIYGNECNLLMKRDNNFHNYSISYYYNNSKNKIVSIFKIDNTFKLKAESEKVLDDMPIVIYGRSIHNTNYIDWVRVRKYAPLEIKYRITENPTISVLFRIITPEGIKTLKNKKVYLYSINGSLINMSITNDKGIVYFTVPIGFYNIKIKIDDNVYKWIYNVYLRKNV